MKTTRIGAFKGNLALSKVRYSRSWRKYGDMIGDAVTVTAI